MIVRVQILLSCCDLLPPLIRAVLNYCRYTDQTQRPRIIGGWTIIAPLQYEGRRHHTNTTEGGFRGYNTWEPGEVRRRIKGGKFIWHLGLKFTTPLFCSIAIFESWWSHDRSPHCMNLHRLTPEAMLKWWSHDYTLSPLHEFSKADAGGYSNSPWWGHDHYAL